MKRMSRKKSAGFSLVELLVAIGILMIITAPILSMFVTSTKMTAASYKLTIATFTAQMRLEEFVGLTSVELSAQDEVKQDGSFWVKAEWTHPYESFDTLAEVTVTVYDLDYDEVADTGSVLCTQTGVVYVDPGP